MTARNRTSLKSDLENGDTFDSTIAGDIVDSFLALEDGTTQSVSGKVNFNGGLAATVVSAGTIYGTLVGATSNSGIFINVKTDYNAVGNGVADDSTAINNAIAAAVSAGGGTVFIPSGTFRVASPIFINGADVTLRGDTRGNSIIQAASAGVTPIKAGTLADLTKYSEIQINDLYVQADTSANSGVRAIQVWGVQRFRMQNVHGKNGESVFWGKNIDRAQFDNCAMEGAANGQTVQTWHLLEGIAASAGDDVTLATWVNCDGDTRANNQIALHLDVEGSGANEFNRLAFVGCRWGGSSTLTGNTGIKFSGGARATDFISNELRYNQYRSIDAGNLKDSSYKIRTKFDSCSGIGTAGNPVTDHIVANNSNTIMEFNLCHFAYCDDVVEFNVNGVNPTLNFNGLECSNVNGAVFNVSASGARINCAAPFSFTASVSAKVKNPQNANWTGQGMRNTQDFVMEADNNFIVSGVATANVVFSQAFDVTASPRHVYLTPSTNAASAAGYWVTNVTAGGFTIAMPVAPVGNITFGYKVKI